ncbi:MAG: cysteine methyltransferase [Betaproteobacteria bacterium HGW-Betaproteobacteria-13]|jgi:methylated-DNA-[protein]-cysteine S-methyltransferase|uniref:Cysteine methyltransferase n=1 Tax=Parazoarcus communis TaxID=41977 RepID=A0A2U8H479_9RHOO|nr:methylated-DNA--[protein]-cysteine S-methyltransferase [Parazoarcus communis]AWI80036.1 cysteine methyltransferase [Parazoarcus communis]PKO80102.1 MAG: cysteine methyltransferase [Betaproteobacteria bacterium HGW-Betaproteobacteria-13]
MPTRQPRQQAFAAVLNLPFGKFGIRIAGDSVTEMVFLPPDTPEQAPCSPVAAAVATHIRDWIASPGQALALPLAACGTAFQRRVRDALQAIPAGEVRTYGEIARLLDSAPRAVGQACGANPFPLAVPCHRVVAAQGIGGFANARDGYLIAAKRWLLNNEMQ